MLIQEIYLLRKCYFLFIMYALTFIFCINIHASNIQNRKFFKLMKQIESIFTLILTFTILSSTYSACVGPNPQLDLMETGIIKLLQSGNKYGIITYTLTPKYQTSSQGFQVALSIAGHDLESPSGYIFFVKAKPRTATLDVTLMVQKKTKWTFVEVSYLITSRTDLYAGSFLTDLFQLNPNEDSTSSLLSIKNTYISGIPKDSEYISKVFICGVDIIDSQNDFDLKLLQSNFNQATGILEINGQIGSLSYLRSLRISYIIYKKAAQFIINENTKSQDYTFTYLSAFEKSKSNSLILKFDFDRYNCIGRKCQSSCLKNSECDPAAIIQNTCFKCGMNEKISEGACVPACQVNEDYDVQSDTCVCKPGFVRQDSDGYCVWTCKQNQVWKNECVCKQNYARYNGVCMACPQHSTFVNGECSCEKNYYWLPEKLSCQYLEPCQQNSTPKLIDGNWQCECNLNYHLIPSLKTCQYLAPCPPNSKLQFTNQNWKCICNKDSYWIQSKYQCQPLTCPPNSDKIDGVCVTCAANAHFEGNDCQCNYGFFGNGRISCKKCHQNCGKCAGQSADQCLVCAEASMILIKKEGKQSGTCSKSGCPPGHYRIAELPKNFEQFCSPCSTYCSECSSQQICNTCIPGFEAYHYYEGEVLTFSYCTEICGDGKRFQYQCDDGNKINGDGCSEDCETEPGYVCQGGSSVQADKCIVSGSTGSLITLTGSLLSPGKVMQGVRISNIPKVLTQKDCAACSELLWPRIISASIIPRIQIVYVKNSKYQFMINFDFGSISSIPVFTISVQINPDYAQYFSDADLSQIQVKTIDPAVLAIASDETPLEMDIFN